LALIGVTVAILKLIAGRVRRMERQELQLLGHWYKSCARAPRPHEFELLRMCILLLVSS
jgi:hypothetical protein